MSDAQGKKRVWLLNAGITLAFACLVLGTWQIVSPSSSPLNYVLTAAPWPAIPRPARPATLPPEQFTGRVAEGYRIARERPELLERMPCYCGCYLTHGHQNNLDCFRDKHGETCDVCLAIAIRAEQLAKKGYSVEDIKALVDQAFAPRSAP